VKWPACGVWWVRRPLGRRRYGAGSSAPWTTARRRRSAHPGRCQAACERRGGGRGGRAAPARRSGHGGHSAVIAPWQGLSAFNPANHVTTPQHTPAHVQPTRSLSLRGSCVQALARRHPGGLEAAAAEEAALVRAAAAAAAEAAASAATPRGRPGGARPAGHPRPGPSRAARLPPAARPRRRPSAGRRSRGRAAAPARRPRSVRLGCPRAAARARLQRPRWWLRTTCRRVSAVFGGRGGAEGWQGGCRRGLARPLSGRADRAASS